MENEHDIRATRGSSKRKALADLSSTSASLQNRVEAEEGGVVKKQKLKKQAKKKTGPEHHQKAPKPAAAAPKARAPPHPRSRNPVNTFGNVNAIPDDLSVNGLTFHVAHYRNDKRLLNGQVVVTTIELSSTAQMQLPPTAASAPVQQLTMGGEPSAPSFGAWRCEMCQFDNEKAKRNCEMCGNGKRTKAQVAAEAQVTLAEEEVAVGAVENDSEDTPPKKYSIYEKPDWI